MFITRTYLRIRTIRYSTLRRTLTLMVDPESTIDLPNHISDSQTVMFSINSMGRGEESKHMKRLSMKLKTNTPLRQRSTKNQEQSCKELVQSSRTSHNMCSINYTKTITLRNRKQQSEIKKLKNDRKSLTLELYLNIHWVWFNNRL